MRAGTSTPFVSTGHLPDAATVKALLTEAHGRETVNYVSNIYKYYIAYRLVSEEAQRRAAERARLKGGPG